MCSCRAGAKYKVQRCRGAEVVQQSRCRGSPGADMEVEVDEVKVVVIAYFYSARGAEVLSWC